VQSALRVGVVIHAGTVPAWIARTIRAIADAEQTELAFITCTGDDAAASERRGLFRALYDAFDTRFFRSGHALLPEQVSPFENSGRDADVVVDFTARAANLTPRFGVWTLRIADTLGAFVRQDETTDALLLANGRPVARARASTDPMSLRRGTGRLLLKCSAMILAALARVQRDGSLWTAGDDLELPAPARVSTASLVRMLAASVVRYVSRQLRRRLRREQWVVAFSFGGDWADLRKFHRIVPPRDRFWADPFVVADGERAHLFVEELVYTEDRGTLAVMEIRRDGTYSAARRILDKPYHLSFPGVFQWNGEYYMLPETGENRTLELYRAKQFPHEWEPAQVLMRDVRSADAAMFEDGGLWWLFLSKAPDGFTFDELNLFHAPSPLGPWTPHPRNPIVTDVTTGRCAGRPFRRDGKLYRVAQNGARRYGGSMNVLEITTLSVNDYAERFVRAIAPDWMPRINATHTLNVDGDVIVVDAARYLWSPHRLAGKNRASAGGGATE
jgi:hypothetical protein